MVEYTVRRAGIDDAPIIARHRVEMFRDMGDVPSEALAKELLLECTGAIDALMRDDAYVGWLAVDPSGRVLAGAGAEVKRQLPRISQDGKSVTKAPVPLVVNVYTESEVRGRGIARALMSVLMQWAATEAFDRVVLHASDAGRPLYQSLGFSSTNEMRWSRKRGG